MEPHPDEVRCLLFGNSMLNFLKSITFLHLARFEAKRIVI